MRRLSLLLLGATSSLLLVRPAYAVCVGAPNGVVAPTEECDDGNNTNGDGCSNTCTIEGEYSCGTAISFANLDIQDFAGSTADWDISADNSNGQQTVNTPTPSIAVFGENAMFGTYEVRMKVEETGGDNDFIGIALGFKPGDQTNNAANYLVIDWKQELQDGVGPGLRLAHIKGVPAGGTHASFAIPQRQCPNANTSCTKQLANGRQFGTTGWADNTDYTWTITYRANSLEIAINGVTELLLSPSDFPGEFAGNVFPAGQIGFYTLSQQFVRYTDLVPITAPSSCNLTQLNPLTRDVLTGTANVVINTAAQLTDMGDVLNGRSVVVKSITSVTSPAGGTGTATVANNGNITFTPSNINATGIYKLQVFACDNRAVVPDCDEATFTVSYSPDRDSDGVPNHLDLDDDDDGIKDSAENLLGIDPNGDADNDGVENYLDKNNRGDGMAQVCTDANNDNICDVPGLDFDRDGDGVANHLDLDSDNDGLMDVVEARLALADTNKNGRLDCTGNYGANGLCNAIETANDSGIVDYDGDHVGPDKTLDTDNDMVPDFLDLDSDNDTLFDRIEGAAGNPICADAGNDGKCDGADGDADGVLGLADTLNGFGVGTYADRPDTNADGEADFRDVDSDGDTLLDSLELAVDTDGDGRPDYRDLDSDGDGLTDKVEGGTRDTDGDGKLDFRDLDSDNDGISDLVEAASGCVDTNPRDGKCNGADANNDGLVDTAANQMPPDTDGDGAQDYRDLDSDNDGIADVTEGGSGCTDTTPANSVCDGPVNANGVPATGSFATPPDTDGDSVADYRDLDSDDDGLVDLEEGGSGCADENGNAVCDGPDTDGDGIASSIDDSTLFGDTTPTVPTNTDTADVPDYRDPDSNNDGMPDRMVSGCPDANSDDKCDGPDTDKDGVVDSQDGFDGFGVLKDTDGDGVSDVNDLDDDNDGIPDVDEGAATNVDTDGDGIIDALDLDSDNDGLPDVIEAGHGGADANHDGIVDCTGGVGANGFCDALETAPESGMAMKQPVDTDGDGVRDFRDLDSDDDGIADDFENGTHCADSPINGVCDGGDVDRDGVVDGADGTRGFGFGMDGYGDAPDTDGDGTPDYRDLDTDGDGINDVDEARHNNTDADHDGKVDGPDADGDGIKDSVDDQPGVFGGAGGCGDTDNDGKPDFRDLDSDDDGISDHDEGGNDDGGGPVDTDGDGTPDFEDVDSDGDGAGDGTDNCRLEVNDDQSDLDGDGIGDGCDPDDNNDGIDDGIGVEGGGCSTTNGGSGALIAFALFGMVAMRRRRRARLALGAVAAVAAVGGTAAAQNAVSSGYNAERFQLTGHRDGIIGVEFADVQGHLALDVGLWAGYANDPVNLYNMTTGDRAGSLVSDRYGGELVAAIQLWNRVELGVGAPLILSQDASVMPTGSDLSGAGLGDLRVSPKITLLKQTRSPIAIAVMASITLPTSSKDDYRGDDGVNVAPSLIISHGHKYGGRFSLQGGYRTRPKAQSLNLTVNDEVFGAFGLGYRFRSSLELDASVDVATGANDFFGAFNRNAAEVRAGIGYDVLPLLRLFADGGIGVAEGFATPDWRALVGIRLHTRDEAAAREEKPLPRPIEDNDPDKDGIIGIKDECPNDPEDFDQFSDGDGCPDPDNDKDTVLDVNDKCINEPGVVEQQGCPEPDTDKDTVIDRLDLCPTTPGLPTLQGCPDRDGDTVMDSADNCPDEPGPVENQGCKKKQLVKITGDKLEILDIVYFALNKATIQARSNGLLDQVAAVLNAHPEITHVVVEGHTDSQGSDASNKKLSQNRANAVMAYLIKKGVAKDRLEAIGYGEERPKADNATKEGRAINRRVEFTIVGGQGVKVDATGPDGSTMEK